MQHKQQAERKTKRASKQASNSTSTYSSTSTNGQREGFRISQPHGRGEAVAAATPNKAKQYADSLRQKHRERFRDVDTTWDEQEEDEEGTRVETLDRAAEYAGTTRERNRLLLQREALMREGQLPGSPNAVQQNRNRMRSMASKAKGAGKSYLMR
jgi:hypothetical protein